MQMQKSGIMEAQIIGNREIVRDVYRLTLQCKDAGGGGQTAFAAATPGQFVNVYLRDRSMLLPRPVSICLADEEQVTLVYRVVGKGTKELSGYQEGETLKISTSLGKGYDLGEVFRVLDSTGTFMPNETGHAALDEAGPDAYGKTIALVAGGLGVPPMLELAKAIRAQLGNGGRSGNGGRFDKAAGFKSIKLICALGFQDELFLTEELRDFCDEVHIATDSGAGGYHGNVLEMMAAEGIKADYYLSCGPKPMLKALAEYCGKENKPLQVSLEERMGCGYGACVGCTCRIKEMSDGSEIIKRKKVCTDGPVFFGNEVIWDE